MPYKKLTPKKVKRYSLKSRKSKVNVAEFSSPHVKDSSFNDFIDSLPSILAAKDILKVRDDIIKARKNNNPVMAAMGAHVVKTGLSPIIIDMIETGVLTSLSFNGAGVIHDFEFSLCGSTSENVDKELKTGSFGMAKETGAILNKTITAGAKKNLGIGEAVGKMIYESKNPYKDKSILATAYKHKVPVTIHVALGTDIIHIHPEVDGASIGKASIIDFQVFTQLVSELEGGVFLNIGSTVIMPEVFLKALSLVRNLGHKVQNFTTVNLDFIQHYRPNVNVVNRPTSSGGKGYSITGHHELMVPLLFAAIKEKM